MTVQLEPWIIRRLIRKCLESPAYITVLKIDEIFAMRSFAGFSISAMEKNEGYISEDLRDLITSTGRL